MPHIATPAHNLPEQTQPDGCPDPSAITQCAGATTVVAPAGVVAADGDDLADSEFDDDFDDEFDDDFAEEEELEEADDDEYIMPDATPSEEE